MQRKLIQTISIIWTIIYAMSIIWIYATEPRSLQEVATNTQVATGTYEINRQRFDSGLELFRREQFTLARDEWAAADPVRQDARTQFYIAYAFYREGWGRLYDDDVFFKQGLDAVNRAITLAPNGTITIDDPQLQMHTAAELKAELEQGVEGSWSDLNPVKLFRKRK